MFALIQDKFLKVFFSMFRVISMHANLVLFCMIKLTTLLIFVPQNDLVYSVTQGGSPQMCLRASGYVLL